MLIIILILGEKSNLPASFTLRRDKTVAHCGQSLAKSADSSSVEYGYTLPRFRLDLAATLPRTASTGWNGAGDTGWKGGGKEKNRQLSGSRYGRAVSGDGWVRYKQEFQENMK